MTVVYPEGTPTLGTTSIWAIEAIADEEAPKLATEILAGSSVNASCYLFPEGWSPGATTARGTRKPRLCSKALIETLNRTTYTIGDLQYVYAPQEDDAHADNALKAALEEGTEIYLLERLGLDAETDAPTVGERTRSHHVRLGPQIPMGDRNDENGEYYILQPVAYIGSGPVDGVIVT